MSDTPKVWIVFRQSGSYEDYREGLIVAYTAEALAIAHRDAANAKVAEARSRFDGWDEWDEAGSPCRHHDVSPWDQGDRCGCKDCTRAGCAPGQLPDGYEGFHDWSYAVEAVDLRDSLPPAGEAAPREEP